LLVLELLASGLTDLVAADFCRTQINSIQKEREPVVMCRKSARRTCEGNMYNAIKTTLARTGSCHGIDDDNLDNLSTSELLDVQDDCTDQVDAMIKWEEYTDSKSKSSSGKSKKKSKGKGKGKKKSKKGKR
jgi:hypothetical protein